MPLAGMRDSSARTVVADARVSVGGGDRRSRSRSRGGWAGAAAHATAVRTAAAVW
jgi:hypothetical protein